MSYPRNLVVAIAGPRAPVASSPPEDIARGIDFAMELVSEPRRTITLEIYREGRDTREVAEEHGMSEKDCQRLVGKALSRLRRSDVLPYILQGYVGYHNAMEARCAKILEELAENAVRAEEMAKKAAELLDQDAHIAERNETIFSSGKAPRDALLEESELYDYIFVHDYGDAIGALAEGGVQTLGDPCQLTEDELYHFDGVGGHVACDIVCGLEALYGMRLPLEPGDGFSPISKHLSKQHRKILRGNSICSLPELCRWSKREIAAGPGAGEISATQLDELLKQVDLELKRDADDAEFYKPGPFRAWVLGEGQFPPPKPADFYEWKGKRT